MQPTQSSIYRDLELLMLWYIPIGNKLPNERALQNIGNYIQDSISESLTACAIALNTSDGKSRLELIDMIVWNLTKCKSNFMILQQWCSKKQKEDHKFRVITESQCLTFTERMADLKRQIGGWRKKTVTTLNGFGHEGNN